MIAYFSTSAGLLNVSPITRMDSRMHIYVMYLTPAELTFLFYSIILTNPTVENMSPAKPRRESNPKLEQRLPLYAAHQATAS